MAMPLVMVVREVVGVLLVTGYSGVGDCDLGSGPQRCIYCHQENHIVDHCWDLHGRPVAHQVIPPTEEAPSFDPAP